jgi:malonyl-CoA O-methyltransferase
MFSTLGPDTLFELREAFAEAGVTPAQKAQWRVKRFIDLHDIGDVLVGAGFVTPVMDMEKLTLTYESLDGLFADLRNSGALNAMLGRPRGLLGRGQMGRVRAAYEARRARRGDARLPATFEVIYGHAWKGQPKRTAAGEAIVSFVPSGEYRAKR